MSGIDGAVSEGLRGSRCRTGVTGVTRLPDRIAKAYERSLVDPVVAALVCGNCSSDAIDVLETAGIGVALEVVFQTGAGTGGGCVCAT